MNDGDFTFELGKIIDRAKARLEQVAPAGERDPATANPLRPAEAKLDAAQTDVPPAATLPSAPRIQPSRPGAHRTCCAAGEV